MNFDSMGISKIISDLKFFLITPRRVNPFIPSLVVYAVWSVGFSFSTLLNVAPILRDSESRPWWLFATSVIPLIMVALTSNLFLRTKIKFFWPISYALIVFLSGIPLLVFWLVNLDLTLNSLLLVYLRLVFVIAVSESVVGFFVEQLRRRASELEAHQVDLVANQEAFRKSVFEYLHDTVQGRLFGVGVQLNQVKHDLPAEKTEAINSVITEIEKIRQKDIKTLGTSLNPPISTFGLLPSLHGLLAEHSAVSHAQFFDLLEPPLTKAQESRLGLGIYRIVEQSVINALVHGKATEIEISLSRRKSDIELKISNNGVGLPSAQAAPGHGFSVIDGWVSSLNGRWDLGEPKGKVTITALLPAL
jgi:signal transduction histidine kinase